MSIELRRTSEGKQVWFAYNNYWPSVPTTIKDDSAVRLAIELEAFREELSEERGGKGKFGHFRQICEWLFPTFIWHRWAIRAGKALCEYKYVGLTGCASSGKSEIMALYGLVSYFAYPAGTLVFVVTTDKTAARQRIWMHVTKRYNEACRGGVEGFKIIERDAFICVADKKFPVEGASKIMLVAAGDKDRDNAVEKLQGSKNRNVILLADEYQDCSPSIVDACGNLRKNPSFQFICSGNAADYFDPHGVFCTPTAGWESITVDSKEWFIKGQGDATGIALHFDGKDSPNFDRYEELGGVNEFDYLYKVEDLIADETDFGTKSPKYWRQCRGFWSSEALDDSIIYPGADLVSHGAMERNVIWQFPPARVIGIDPAYSNGGDRFICYLLEYGMTKRNLPIIYFNNFRELKMEGSSGDLSRNYRMVKKAKELAAEWGIPPENVAVDATGKNPIGDIFHEEWSKEILLVDFQGLPSEMIYKQPVGKPSQKCSEVFDRRVSELWYVGRQFLNSDQLAGISADHARELSIRRYKEEGKKIKIESKPDMRERTGGISPDISDAGWVGVELLRQRHKALPGGGGQRNNMWQDLFGPKKNVDKPAVYQFKSLQTMQSTAKRPESKGSMDDFLKFGRR